MSDYNELKKAAEACGPLPWRLIELGVTRLGVRDDHGFIAFMDISHPAKYGACPDREAKARFIGHATPAAVVALIAELDEAKNGMKHSGAIRLKKELERLKAEVESFKQGAKAEADAGDEARAEVRKLKAENESLRKDAERYRFVSQLAWYVDRAAYVYDLKKRSPGWSSDQPDVDADDVEEAIDATMSKEAADA
jgi:hypothetical protein